MSGRDLLFPLFLAVTTLVSAGPFFRALRNRDQRRLLPRLARSWRMLVIVGCSVTGLAIVVGFDHRLATLIAATLLVVIAVIVELARQLRRRENAALAAFAQQRGLSFVQTPKFTTPFWTPPRIHGSPPPPQIDELVAGLRQLGRGSMDVQAMAVGRVDGRDVVVANVSTNDSWWSAVWVDVRLPGAELVVAQPSTLRNPVFRAERRRVELPHVAPDGRQISATAGLREADIEGLLGPVGLVERQQPETIALRLAEQGLVVARPRAVAENLGLDELLGLALAVARAVDRRVENAALFT